MTTTMHWKASLDARALGALARAIGGLAAYTGAPVVRVDASNPEPASAGWLDAALAQATDEIFAKWDSSYQRFLSVHVGDVAQMALPEFPRSPAAALEVLATLPFEVASFDSIHPWRPGYEGPSFGGFHFPLGWGCAFRGDGHRRLVSRRWLEHGPWKLWRGANDTTLIQFHDLDADAESALAQARSGHDRMGPSDDGGYLAATQRIESTLDGLYDPEQQKLRIVVAGREVTSRELLDACALRASGGGDPPRPIRSLAYAFLDEAAARRWVRELRLRDIECWAFVGGVEQRIDGE